MCLHYEIFSQRILCLSKYAIVHKQIKVRIEYIKKKVSKIGFDEKRKQYNVSQKFNFISLLYNFLNSFAFYVIFWEYNWKYASDLDG